MALLLGLAMLPAGGIAMQVGLNAVAARQSAYEESLGRQALQSIASERNAVDEVREMLRVLASSPAMQEIRSGDCRQWLGGVMQRYTYLTAIAVTTENGTVECSEPHVPAGFSPPSNPLRERAQARDGFTVGFVGYGAISHQPVLGAMEPIRDARGRRLGFVGAALSLPYLKGLLDQNRIREGVRAAIVDNTGFVIAESSSPSPHKIELPSADQIHQLVGGDPAYVQVGGGTAVVVPLHAPDLYAVMSWPDDQPVLQRSWGIAASLAAPLLIWMLAVAAGWFAIEVFVARPLSTLETTARGYARGEELNDSEELASAPDEIRSLRRTLAAMAKTLRGREQRLVEALAEERALLREVHHRVKNNLQMVASLLNIQARGSNNEGEAWGLARAHDRVQLLALVHQRIYSSGELRELRLDDLVAEIARQLLQARGAAAKDVRLALHLEPTRDDIDRTMPLTFMVGEAVSAALDHMNGVEGELELCVAQGGDGEVRIAVTAKSNQETSAASPSARLIDAFARQVGADLGRNPAAPFDLWVRVPPVSKPA